MKKRLFLVVVMGVVLAAGAPAYGQLRSDIATDRAQLQSDRQAMVAANLPLTDEQSKAFWPLYREYREEMQRLGDRLVEIILNYAESSDSLSDDQATTMLDDLLGLQKDEVKVKTAWVPKFRKVLPPKSVTRFYQIENKLDAILRFDAVDRVPLVVGDSR